MLILLSFFVDFWVEANRNFFSQFFAICFIYFHISEQQPCFFLGSWSPIETFSDLEGAGADEVLTWVSTPGFDPDPKVGVFPFFTPLWDFRFPFELFSRGSRSLDSREFSASNSFAFSALAFNNREKSFNLPSFHKVKISSASWLSSPSGRKGLSQP